jgi:hypothetical protein
MNNCIIVRDLGDDEEFWTGQRWSVYLVRAMPYSAPEGARVVASLQCNGCELALVANYGHDNEQTLLRKTPEQAFQ